MGCLLPGLDRDFLPGKKRIKSRKIKLINHEVERFRLLLLCEMCDEVEQTSGERADLLLTSVGRF